MISPAFIVLAVISAGLWFISRLSHTYTSQISIPVELVTDYGADLWVSGGKLSVRTLVKGDGRDLLLYKLGLGPKVIIPVSALQLSQNDSAEPYLYSVAEKSMERALSSEQTRFTVVMITDTIEQIKVSMIGEARLPIVAKIEVNCSPQYMVRGGIQLKPDSVTVKAPLAMLDTMREIATDPVRLDKVNSLRSDAVSLVIPPNVVAQTSVVRYLIDVVGYTEQRYTVPITVPAGCLVIPAAVQVVVHVPLNVTYPEAVRVTSSVTPVVGERYSRVVVEGLPSAAIVMSVTPEFVEVYTVD